MLIESQAGWHYGGCLYHPIPRGTTATDGENGALVWALLWAITMSNQHWNKYGLQPIFFTFNFDAMSSGYPAAGFWRTTHAQNWRTLMRSLAQLLPTRHGLQALLWQHVPANSGHAWNEAVDVLAKHAAAQHFQVESPNALWESWMTLNDHLTALQWLWCYELMQVNDPRVPPLINGQLHCTLAAERACANLESTTSTRQASPAFPQTVQLRIKLATANVLTLSSGTTTRPIVARQTILMEQMEQEGCTIVGVQETRHYHLVALGNNFYHIFGHPASQQGTDGIQLWISKRLPVDDQGTTIRAEDVRVVASGENYIIAKLRLRQWRCLITTCRAPHSGRPRAEAVQFWSMLNHILQHEGKNWPILFCGNTNAHLGHQPTDAVGPLWPSMENQAGQVFHEWLLQHDLFLPATFAHIHTGSEHATFLAPDGRHEARIDYVALPRGLPYTTFAIPVDDPTVHRSRPGSKPAIDVQDLAHKLQQSDHINALHHHAVPAPPWEMDPHQSASTWATTVNNAISRIAQPKGLWKRKWHISAKT